MRTFNYLIRRLLQPGMSLFTAGLFGLVLLAAILGQPLFAYQSQDIIRLQEKGQAQLEFHAYGSQDEILVKYDREEFIRELTEDYDPHLRAQLDALGPADAPIPDEEKSVMTYRNYLLSLQAQADLKLRTAQGLITDENYYFGLYAPGITLTMSLPTPDPTFSDISNPNAWEPVIRESLASKSIILQALGKNLQGQLPLRLDSFSASGILYELNRSFHFLLVLFPLTCFLLLFHPADRNLRIPTPLLTVQKILAGFLYSALAIVVLRVLLYAFLTLRFGDAEGAMSVLPPWSFYSSASQAKIYRLREYIVYLTLMDLGFLFFVSILLAVWHELTGDHLVAAAATGFSLLLPGAAIIPALDLLPITPVRFTPFQYLFWDTHLASSPESSLLYEQRMAAATAGSFYARPEAVLFSLLLGSLLLLALIPLISGLRRRFSAYRSAKLRAIKPDV